MRNRRKSKWALYCLAMLCAFQSLAQRPLPLVEHLERAAQFYSLSLVFSEDAIPDTSVVYAFDPESRAEATFAELTSPFGLEFFLLENRIIIRQRVKRRFSISGFIQDAQSGERLVGATIYYPRRQRGVVSNNYGFFSIHDIEEEEPLLISYVGYNSSEQRFVSQPTRQLIVALEPSLELGIVEITAPYGVVEALPTEGKPSSPNALEAVEYLNGRPDINSWLSMQSGVQAAPGGFRGYGIRGTDPEQLLTIVDDATLYLPSHLAGYFSMIPGEALRSFTFFKDAGPVRFGDRVGGVVDLRLREGNREEFVGTLSPSLSDLSTTLEGPVGRGSYFFSGRLGLSELWLDILTPSARNPSDEAPLVDVHFQDFAFKVNQDLGERQTVYASVFYGSDRYADRAVEFTNDGPNINQLTDRSRRNWQNLLFSLRHSYAAGSHWFINSTLTVSNFQYDAQDIYQLVREFGQEVSRINLAGNLFSSQIFDRGLKVDVSYNIDKESSLYFGIDAVAHRFSVGTFGVERVDDALVIDTLRLFQGIEVPSINSLDFSAYLGGDYSPTRELRLEGGLRFASQFAEGSNYFAVLPRLKVLYDANSRTQLQLSAGEARQFIHSVATQNAALPREIWLPTTQGLSPQESWYMSFGVSRKLAPHTTATLSTYFQRLRGLARFDDDFVSDNGQDWVDNVRTGRGRSQGLELQGQTKLGKFTWDYAYTLQSSTRQFRNAFGDFNPVERSRLDQRHQISIMGQWKVNDSWTLGSSWNFGSGLPTRLPARNAVGPVYPQNNLAFTNPWIYSGPQQQLPETHSLNVGATYEKQIKTRQHRVVFGVQNIYLKKNPIFINLRASSGVGQGNGFEFTQVFVPPLLPFARYTINI